MAVPIVSTVTSPVQIGNQVVVTGANFGRVVAVALEDTVTHEFIDCPDFIVDWGTSLHLTVPRATPVGFYEVVLADLDGNTSVNEAGAVNVVAGPVSLPPEPAWPEAGTTLAAVRERLRYELGDYTETFSVSIPGDGSAADIDLPAEAIASMVVTTVDGDGNSTTLTAGTDYTADTRRGVINLAEPLGEGVTLTAEGTRAQFFTDAELDMFIESALLKHGHNTTTRTVVRDPVSGFKRYYIDPRTLANLPAVEVHPVAILATIEALWALAADASYDINVVTSEGTSLPRQERYAAIMQMISAQQARYDQLAQQLGVGMNRIEMFTLRRVSRTTGRLVPVYQSREYDEHGPPTRVYPPVDRGVNGGGSTKREWVGHQYHWGP